MTVRIAFHGFRHNHIFDLYARASADSDLAIVGASEENLPAREAAEGKGVSFSHNTLDEMLEEAVCDVVAIGDYYSRRGQLVLEALRHGRHVICDKPLCTSLREWDEIQKLARESSLSVMCMLDLRDWGHFLALRQAVRDGLIGEVRAVSFGGQHELKFGQRPSWYFEEESHGGTLNDLAVHGIDLVSWMTGLRFSSVRSARTWNACLPEVPHFQQGAQLMAELENGAGVLGDVSYLMPAGQTAASPHYWRTTLWGSKGLAETSFGDRTVRVWLAGENASHELKPAADRPGNYLKAFLREIEGTSRPEDLTTADSLEATMVALVSQDAADRGKHAIGLFERKRSVVCPPQ